MVAMEMSNYLDQRCHTKLLQDKFQEKSQTLAMFALILKKANSVNFNFFFSFGLSMKLLLLFEVLTLKFCFSFGLLIKLLLKCCI